MRYRKKPVIIEAELYDGSVESFLKISKWIGNLMSSMTSEGKIEIPTLEGIITASPGDYIIQGVNGEFYPCKPDIFDKTYERVV
jgi:hypothetical protein